MLTEAGETFQQREMEIQKLKDLVQDYEKRLEQQVSGDLNLFDNTELILGCGIYAEFADLAPNFKLSA